MYVFILYSAANILICILFVTYLFLFVFVRIGIKKYPNNNIFIIKQRFCFFSCHLLLIFDEILV